MKRGGGIAALKKQKAMREKLAKKGTENAEADRERMTGLLDEFKVTPQLQRPFECLQHITAGFATHARQCRTARVECVSLTVAVLHPQYTDILTMSAY